MHKCCNLILCHVRSIFKLIFLRQCVLMCIRLPLKAPHVGFKRTLRSMGRSRKGTQSPLRHDSVHHRFCHRFIMFLLPLIFYTDPLTVHIVSSVVLCVHTSNTDMHELHKSVSINQIIKSVHVCLLSPSRQYRG